MCAALREFSPEYAKAFEDVLNRQFMYNYNVILAALKLIFQKKTKLYLKLL